VTLDQLNMKGIRHLNVTEVLTLRMTPIRRSETHH